MKPKSIQYKIADPCHADWNEMTPETTGRFCGSCAKTVVDFTQMSDFSIVNYLEKHQNEKMCGRFTQPQLDRVYQRNQPVFTPTFDLRAIVLGLALTTFSAVHSFAQTEPQEPVRIDTLKNEPGPMILGKIAIQHFDHEKEKKASGTIFNLASDFKNITVVMKNGEGKVLKTTKPDVNGKFEFDLNWKLNPVYLQVSGTGYETSYFYLSSVPSLNDIRIILQNQPETIRGEVEMIKGNVKTEKQ